MDRLEIIIVNPATGRLFAVCLRRADGLAWLAGWYRRLARGAQSVRVDHDGDVSTMGISRNGAWHYFSVTRNGDAS